MSPSPGLVGSRQRKLLQKKQLGWEDWVEDGLWVEVGEDQGREDRRGRCGSGGEPARAQT